MVDTDDTRRTMDDGQHHGYGIQTTPGVWHKLPTGEIKIETVPNCVALRRLAKLKVGLTEIKN